MQTARIVVDQELARERLQQYRNAKAPKTEKDIAIMRAYRQIAQGKIIIQAYESIRRAGLNDEALPKLAMCRANEKKIICDVWNDRVTFKPEGYYRGWSRVTSIEWQQTPRRDHKRGMAIVPLVPLPQRPKAALSGYHILWEADWHKVPVDPMLLRKLSGDLWLVVAAWDLTDVERAVIAQ